MPNRLLDDYYTSAPVASECADIVRSLVHHRARTIILEPSAGSGAFLRAIQGIERTVACDIMPTGPDIIEADFLESTAQSLGLPVDSSIITVVGNPPFGKNSSLAVKFFNKCAEMADTIAFIVPLTFRKGSTIKKLDKHFHLVYDKELPENAFELDGEPYDVPTCFQVWIRKPVPRCSRIVPENIWLDFVSKEEAEFAIRRVGGSAGKVLDGLDHKEPSTYFVREKVPGVKEALQAIDFSEVAMKTAGMGSISKDEIMFALEDYFQNKEPEFEEIEYIEIDFFADSA